MGESVTDQLLVVFANPEVSLYFFGADLTVQYRAAVAQAVTIPSGSAADGLLVTYDGRMFRSPRSLPASGEAWSGSATLSTESKTGNSVSRTYLLPIERPESMSALQVDLMLTPTVLCPNDVLGEWTAPTVALTENGKPAAPEVRAWELTDLGEVGAYALRIRGSWNTIARSAEGGLVYRAPKVVTVMNAGPSWSPNGVVVTLCADPRVVPGGAMTVQVDGAAEVEPPQKDLASVQRTYNVSLPSLAPGASTRLDVDWGDLQLDDALDGVAESTASLILPPEERSLNRTLAVSLAARDDSVAAGILPDVDITRKDAG